MVADSFINSGDLNGRHILETPAPVSHHSLLSTTMNEDIIGAVNGRRSPSLSESMDDDSSSFMSDNRDNNNQISPRSSSHQMVRSSSCSSDTFSSHLVPTWAKIIQQQKSKNHEVRSPVSNSANSLSTSNSFQVLGNIPRAALEARTRNNRDATNTPRAENSTSVQQDTRSSPLVAAQIQNVNIAGKNIEQPVLDDQARQVSALPGNKKKKNKHGQETHAASHQHDGLKSYQSLSQ